MACIVLSKQQIAAMSHTRARWDLNESLSSLSIRDVLSRGAGGPSISKADDTDSSAHVTTKSKTGDSHPLKDQTLRSQDDTFEKMKYASFTSRKRPDPVITSVVRGTKPSGFSAFMAATDRPHRYSKLEIVVLEPSSSSSRNVVVDTRDEDRDVSHDKVTHHVMTDRGQSWFFDLKGGDSKDDWSGEENINLMRAHRQVCGDRVANLVKRMQVVSAGAADGRLDSGSRKGRDQASMGSSQAGGIHAVRSLASAESGLIPRKPAVPRLSNRHLTSAKSRNMDLPHGHQGTRESELESCLNTNSSVDQVKLGQRVIADPDSHEADPDPDSYGAGTPGRLLAALKKAIRGLSSAPRTCSTVSNQQTATDGELHRISSDMLMYSANQRRTNLIYSAVQAVEQALEADRFVEAVRDFQLHALSFSEHPEHVNEAISIPAPKGNQTDVIDRILIACDRADLAAAPSSRHLLSVVPTSASIVHSNSQTCYKPQHEDTPPQRGHISDFPNECDEPSSHVAGFESQASSSMDDKSRRRSKRVRVYDNCLFELNPDVFVNQDDDMRLLLQFRRLIQVGGHHALGVGPYALWV